MSDVDLNPYASPASPEPLLRDPAGDGKHCPVCSRDVGTWRIATVLGATHVRCSSCAARLVYEYHWSVNWVLVLALVAAATMSIAVAVALVMTNAGPLVLPAILATAVGLWSPVELALALYLRKHGILKRLA